MGEHAHTINSFISLIDCFLVFVDLIIRLKAKTSCACIINQLYLQKKGHIMFKSTYHVLTGTRAMIFYMNDKRLLKFHDEFMRMTIKRDMVMQLNFTHLPKSVHHLKHIVAS